VKVLLIHGIHSERGGATARLRPYFEREGFEVAVVDYGYALGIFSRFENGARARAIAANVGPFDILVGHSNGGTLAWMVQKRAHASGLGLILIHPALDEDVRFRNALWVDVYHGEREARLAVSLAATRDLAKHGDVREVIS